MALGECEDCGEPATAMFDEGEQYAFWTRQPRHTPVCSDCWTRRDNREPPDPDGEDICRDYRAEERDRQIEAQRIKHGR